MPISSCSRCGAVAHLAASIEFRRHHLATTHILCVWCVASIEEALAPVPFEHMDSCRCDACDPDRALELQRLPA